MRMLISALKAAVIVKVNDMKIMKWKFVSRLNTFVVLMLTALFYSHSAMAELKQFKSKIGIDYSKYGDMAANFQAGEIEYLASIEKIIISKPEKIRERLKLAFYKKWEKWLDVVYNSWWKDFKWTYANMFINNAISMVLSWKWLKWWYKKVYDIAKQEQNIKKLDSILDKLWKNQGAK